MNVKKHLSWLLSAAMAISTFSVPVLAADATTAVAQVNGEYYDSLIEAVTNANGAEITMLKDVDLGDVSVKYSPQITLPETLNLNLGGHELMASNSHSSTSGSWTNYNPIFYASESNVTITNGTLTGTSNGHLILALNGGSLTMDKVTVNFKPLSEDNGIHAAAIGSNKANLTNVTINTERSTGFEAEGGTSTLTNCEINQTQGNGGNSYSETALAVSHSGTLTVNGGTYTSSTYGAYVFSSGGTINWYDATVEAPTALRGLADTSSYPYSSANINVYSGTVKGALLSKEDNAMLKISGGSFTADPTKYLADGLEATKGTDDNYTVSNKTGGVAYIGSIPYDTLEEAVSAAQNGDTITLKENCTVSELVSKPSIYGLTLDLGGNTLTTGSNGLTVKNCSSMTFKNGTVKGNITGSADDSTGITIETDTTVEGDVISNGYFTIGGTVKGSATINYDYWYVSDPNAQIDGDLIYTGTGKSSISKGIFNGNIIAKNGTINITGGTFAIRPDDKYIDAHRYTAITNPDGETYTVTTLTDETAKAKGYNVRNASKYYYETIDKAVEAGQQYASKIFIYLIKDHNENFNISGSNDVSLSLEGHNLAGTGTVSSKTLTIQGIGNVENIPQVQSGAALQLSGGTYKEDPQKYLYAPYATEYEESNAMYKVNGDGTYTVSTGATAINAEGSYKSRIVNGKYEQMGVFKTELTNADKAVTFTVGDHDVVMQLPASIDGTALIGLIVTEIPETQQVKISIK